MNLDKLFHPRAIAMIGASRSKKKIGGAILNNLIASKYKGSIFPINLLAKTIQGLPCFKSVLKVSQSIDLAIIAIPAQKVPVALRQCGEKRIRFAVIISAGFKETGKRGRQLSDHVDSIARKYGIKILGPNSLGLINTQHDMDASFSGVFPSRGTASFISQSGAIIVGLVDWSKETGIGLNKLISLGNANGISAVDILEYLAADASTTAIGMYLEEISKGQQFINAISRISHEKPVIVLKAGVSDAGQKAIASHTGSLAGSYRVISSALKQAGAIQAHDLEELFNLMKYFSTPLKTQTNKVTIVSNAGGPSIIATDVISKKSLSLYSIPASTQQQLKKNLPPLSSVKNPIDVVGDADLTRFKKVIRSLIADPLCGTILVIVTPQTITPLESLALFLAAIRKKTTVNIITSFIGGQKVRAAKRILTANKIMHFNYPYDALNMLSHAQSFAPEKQIISFGKKPRVNNCIETIQMPYHRTLKILTSMRLPIMRGVILTSSKEVDRIKHYPVALKVLSSLVVHKAASDGIYLHVQNKKEAITLMSELLLKFKSNKLEGILAQPMINKGVEVMVGTKKDPLFGTVTMVGIGGSYAEELNDTSLHIGTVTRQDAEQMIENLKNQHLIKTVDKSLLSSILQKIYTLTEKYSNICELDLNPIKIYSKGGHIIDARILTAKK